MIHWKKTGVFFIDAILDEIEPINIGPFSSKQEAMKFLEGVSCLTYIHIEELFLPEKEQTVMEKENLQSICMKILSSPQKYFSKSEVVLLVTRGFIIGQGYQIEETARTINEMADFIPGIKGVSK